MFGTVLFYIFFFSNIGSSFFFIISFWPFITSRSNSVEVGAEIKVEARRERALGAPRYMYGKKEFGVCCCIIFFFIPSSIFFVVTLSSHRSLGDVPQKERGVGVA